MLATLGQIFNPRNKDLQRKILFTFAALFIFKLGTVIIVPGIDRREFPTDGILGLINAMGGGAMENFSIFALGVMPYITASIIIQLLAMDIVPYLKELSEQGQMGKNKMNQITRVVGIILAFVQGYIFSLTYIQDGTVIQYLQTSLILTAGTAFLLWMGDQITSKGIGNGISMIIMAGIIFSLPMMFFHAWGSLVDTASVQTAALGITMFVLFLILFIGIILGIIFVETAERRIPIQYANKSTYGTQQSYIPFKLNSAGVIPVIFASAVVSVPSLVAAFINNDAMTLFIDRWIVMTTPTGLIIYMLTILGFSYFYTFVQLKPKDLSENLNKNGGFIPGTRPGDETITHITSTLKRITLVGGLSLALLASLPIIFQMFSTGMHASVTIGGTGLLIVVGVALETYKQIEAGIATRTYSRGRQK